MGEKQDNLIEKKENKQYNAQIPAYWDFAIADGKLWYSSSLFNGLFCQELERGEPEFVGFFPNEDFYQPDLYRRVILAGRELVFIPWFAKNISIYNLNDGNFITVKIPDTNIMGKYISVELIEDKIYLFPTLTKKALCLDVSKRVISELEEFDEFLKDMLNKNEQVFYWLGTARIEEQIYLLVKGTNQLLCYNWKKKKIFLQELAENTMELEGLAAYNRMLFVRIKNQNKLLCLDSVTEDITVHDLEDLPEQKEQSMMVAYGEKIYFYFLKRNLLCEMSMDSFRLRKTIPLEERSTSFLVKQIEKDLFFMPYYGSALYRYDMQKESCISISSDNFKITTEWLQNYIESQRTTIYESELMDVKTYIDAIALMKKGKKEENKNASEKIWKILC